MSTNKLPIHFRLLYLVGFLFLAACAGQKEKLVDASAYPTDMVDQSWLSGQPCLAPCWQGLMPGVSSREEAIEIANSLTFVSGEMKPMDSHAEGYVCKIPPESYCVYMAFDDNKLNFVTLGIEYQLTVEQMVDMVGPPDGYVVSERQALKRTCDIEVLWISKQVKAIITYENDRGCTIFFLNNRFPQDIQVNSIDYLRPGEIEQFIDDILNSMGIEYFSWGGFDD
jgi:hypothetical protein